MQISKYIANRIRILFLLGLFYVLMTYTQSVFAFMFMFYCILSDLSDIENDTSKIQEEKEPWSNFLTKRKGF